MTMMDDHHELIGLVYRHMGQAIILGVTGSGGTGKKREYREHH